MPAPSSGILAPPFAQARGAAAPERKGADPFGAAAAPVVAEKKVTLVVDESAIKDSQVARRAWTKNLIILGVGGLVGVLMGFMVGNTAGDRKLWSMVIQDGKDIYKMVTEVSKVVGEAKGHVTAMYEASRGGPGRQARVDYKAIEAALAIKKPLGANAFHRRRYRAFQAGTVDDLFDYYNNINVIWDKFTRMGALTAGEGKRKILDKAAQAADEVLNNEYGLVPFLAGKDVVGGLVFVTIPPSSQDSEDEEASLALNVSSRPGGKTVEKKRFVGQDKFLTSPTEFVIVINKARSMGILAEAANPFATYRAEVTELNLLMNKVMETQGRLIKALGEVATLE